MRALNPRFAECLTRHGDPEGRVLHQHFLVNGQFEYQSVIARGVMTLRGLNIPVDFDEIDCAEGFIYPEEY